MHVADGTGHRRPIRLAVARAAVYECRQPGSLGDPLGKIAPEAQRPEALVQEHQCRAAGPANVLGFDLLAADAEEHGQKLSRKAKTRQGELAMAIADEDETFP